MDWHAFMSLLRGWYSIPQSLKYIYTNGAHQLPECFKVPGPRMSAVVCVLPSRNSTIFIYLFVLLFLFDIFDMDAFCLD